MKKTWFGLSFLFFLFFCNGSQKQNEDLKTEKGSKNCKSALGLYVFAYGTGNYPNRFLNVSEESGNRTIVYLFYLIRIPGKNILVDSGFVNDSYKKQFGFFSFESPDVLLKKCGMEPKEITDVILTHFHFDHSGGIFLFPSATIHIQNHDFDLLKKQSYFPNQREFLVRLNKQNKLHTFNGTYSVFPELQILFTGGHTPGSQAVEWIVSSESQFLITGDECYLVRECRNGIGLPVAAVFSLKRNRDFIEYLRVLNGKGTKILTLHDPSILEDGKEILPGIRLLHSL
ncbi:N-acyl homoserine lactonase family protein [Leptospira sp. WS92.C1]